MGDVDAYESWTVGEQHPPTSTPTSQGGRPASAVTTMARGWRALGERSLQRVSAPLLALLNSCGTRGPVTDVVANGMGARDGGRVCVLVGPRLRIRRREGACGLRSLCSQN